MFSFTGFNLCFGDVKAIFQSFFHKLLYRFTQNLFMCKNCSLLAGIDCVTDKLKATFS